MVLVDIQMYKADNFQVKIEKEKIEDFKKIVKLKRENKEFLCTKEAVYGNECMINLDYVACIRIYENQ